MKKPNQVNSIKHLKNLGISSEAQKWAILNWIKHAYLYAFCAGIRWAIRNHEEAKKYANLNLESIVKDQEKNMTW